MGSNSAAMILVVKFCSCFLVLMAETSYTYSDYLCNPVLIQSKRMMSVKDGVLKDLTKNTQPGKAYCDKVWVGDTTMYGYAECSSSLDKDGCSNCLDHAWDYFEHHCYNNVGGRVNVNDRLCFMRFEAGMFPSNYMGNCNRMTCPLCD